MGFIKLSSENENMSWVIEKNPSTGIVIKANRSGCFFSYFSDAGEYCIYFKDPFDEISYKKHEDAEFEYISNSQYNNARLINDAIEEVLRSAREGIHTYQKDGVEYDTPSHHKFIINLCETQYKTIGIFKRYFPDLITSEEISINNFKIIFENKNLLTLSYFLNVINLFGIFAVLNSDDYTYIHEGIISKYLKIINKIDAPYFIRYLFKVRLLRSEKKFDAVKKDLEKTNLYSSVLFTHGSSHEARIEWIKNKITLSSSIIDIGVGIDMKYLRFLAPMLQENNLTYYAIEIDEEARERIKRHCKFKGIENVELFSSLKEFMEYYETILKCEKLNYSVLCTEVLEHNELAIAEDILKTIIEKVNFKTFLITVPNSEFNKFYGIEHFRHDDHKWEMSFDEFKKFIHNKIKSESIIYSWYDVVIALKEYPLVQG